MSSNLTFNIGSTFGVDDACAFTAPEANRTDRAIVEWSSLFFILNTSLSELLV
ncbi:hypothetical protein VSA01S_10890 [Vibrio sagamiensis NBRC 104589]|uniref:Uncharacterized protein n=1 Tax=Vibrio sagamiensis NBRC 104589 TaxID=1219064 RepID=A0A511QCQ9_9VIBR|nr:hypothetical protein VSA01S_10890 [Vibrio sagamiensis NBRC 104589]